MWLFQARFSPWPGLVELSEDIDVQLHDVIKMFDKLWLQEAVNDLYEANLRNDNLYLLYLENKMNNVAVKTPGSGMTERRYHITRDCFCPTEGNLQYEPSW